MGQRVKFKEFRNQKQWKEGTVVASTELKFKIKFSDGSGQWQCWVPRERVQLPDELEAAVKKVTLPSTTSSEPQSNAVGMAIPPPRRRVSVESEASPQFLAILDQLRNRMRSSPRKRQDDELDMVEQAATLAGLGPLPHVNIPATPQAEIKLGPAWVGQVREACCKLFADNKKNLNADGVFIKGLDELFVKNKAWSPLKGGSTEQSVESFCSNAIYVLHRRLRVTTSELEAVQARLKQSGKALTANKEALARSEKEFKRLETEVSGLNQRISTDEGKLKAKDAMIEELKAKEAAVAEQLPVAPTLSDEETEESAKAERKLKKQAKKLKAARKALEEEKARLAEERRQLEAQRTTAEDSIAQLKRETEEFENMKERLRQERSEQEDRLQEHRKSLKKEELELTASKDKMNQLYAQISQLEKKLADETRQHTRTKAKLQLKEESNTNLREQVASYQKQMERNPTKGERSMSSDSPRKSSPSPRLGGPTKGGQLTFELEQACYTEDGTAPALDRAVSEPVQTVRAYTPTKDQPCQFWLSPKGCRRARRCRFQHPGYIPLPNEVPVDRTRGRRKRSSGKSPNKPRSTATTPGSCVTVPSSATRSPNSEATTPTPDAANGVHH